MQLRVQWYRVTGASQRRRNTQRAVPAMEKLLERSLAMMKGSSASGAESHSAGVAVQWADGASSRALGVF